MDPAIQASNTTAPHGCQVAARAGKGQYTMRLSAGGFYQINGSALSAVSGVSAGPGAADCWRDRQADLWTESTTLIHVHHRLTDEELGLWGAMQRELDRIHRTLNGIEAAARVADLGRAAAQSAGSH